MTCGWCGKDTFNTDVEYLIGEEHLACVLRNESEALPLPIQLKGWDKMKGRTLTLNGLPYDITEVEEGEGEWGGWGKGPSSNHVSNPLPAIRIDLWERGFIRIQTFHPDKKLILPIKPVDLITPDTLIGVIEGAWELHYGGTLSHLFDTPKS